MTKQNKDTRRLHCENCDFYRRHSQEGGECSQYEFIMPKIGWYTLCQQWQSGGQTIDLSNLKPDRLYYYSQATDNILYAEMAHFNQLQHQVISVSIRRDKAYGWVIYPRKQYRYFPSTGDFINIIVGERNSKFEIVNEERNLAFELIPMNQSWERHDHPQQVFMLASIESPDLLYDWYDTIIDVQAFTQAETVSPSLHAFMIVNEKSGEYRLLADLLNYQKYLR